MHDNPQYELHVCGFAEEVLRPLRTGGGPTAWCGEVRAKSLRPQISDPY